MPEIHHLQPLMTYSALYRTITVALLVVSEEATAGFVVPKAERPVPYSSGFSQRSLNSSLA